MSDFRDPRHGGGDDRFHHDHFRPDHFRPEHGWGGPEIVVNPWANEAWAPGCGAGFYPPVVAEPMIVPQAPVVYDNGACFGDQQYIYGGPGGVQAGVQLYNPGVNSYYANQWNAAPSYYQG